MIDYLVRRITAWWRDVPFELHKFWIPLWTRFKKPGELYQDRFKVASFSGKGSTGDVFGLLREFDKVHLYEITARYRSSGSDHIATPYKHDWRYVGTMTQEEYEEAQDELKDQQSTHLLQLW